MSLFQALIFSCIAVTGVGCRNVQGPHNSDLGGVGDDDGGGPDNADMGDGSTTLVVHYPAGTHTMSLRGDAPGLTWNAGVPMTSPDGNTFTYVFPPTAGLPARAEWKPLLDDTTWSRGANFVLTPGATVEIWPHFVTTSGQVRVLIDSFTSSNLPDARRVWAYLPAAYDENTLARFPVMYMHDGQNLFDPALAFGGNEWKVDETLNGDAEGPSNIAEVIVIGIGNTAARMGEYTPVPDPMDGGGDGDKYLKLITDELKPKVDSMLRTHPERESTGIMGSSLGGLISAWAGLTRADVFGRVGAMSPSTWWDNNWLIAQAAAPAGMQPLKLYVDCGNPDDDYVDTNVLVTTYLAHGWQEGVGFEHVYASGAQHSETYWSMRLPGALAFLLGRGPGR